MNAWIQFKARVKNENNQGGIQIEGRIEKTSSRWTIRGCVPAMTVETTKEFTARGGNYGQKAGDVVKVKQVRRVHFEVPKDEQQNSVKFLGGTMYGGLSFEPWGRSFATLDEALEVFKPGLIVLLETDNEKLEQLTITHVDECVLGWHHMHDLKTQRKMDRLRDECEATYAARQVFPHG